MHVSFIPLKLLLVAILSASVSSIAEAATVYGTLTRNNSPLGNVPVLLTCGTVQSSGQSSAQGNYSLNITTSGACILKVDGKQETVNLGSQPVRYDFDVPPTGQRLIQK